MSEKLKFDPTSEPAPENADTGKEKINFENGKRPNYRYYYHGTLVEPLFREIEKSSFEFNEYLPNLTISPEYAFNNFLTGEIKKGSKQIKSRSKHLDPDKKGLFKPEHLREDNGVMLVIEPTDEYRVHSTNEGLPNVFSTPDQIPDDTDKTIRTRVWTSNQKMIFKEPIFQRFNDGVKRPGMFLNRRMLPNGEWVSLDRDKRTNIPGEFPLSSVKLAIKKDPEFLKIFENIRRDLNQGNKIDLAVYKKRLTDYFDDKDKKGRGIIIRDEVQDKAELAENMVVGEFEHSLVSAMRRLYLDIERFKGKKVMHPTKEEEAELRPAKTEDEIKDKIKQMRSLEPDNEVFKKYIDIYTAGLEKELNS